MDRVSRAGLAASFGILALALALGAPDAARAFDAAALGSGAQDPAARGAAAASEPEEEPLPRLLASADAGLYQQIFDVQEEAAWEVADKLMARLADPLLKGHVLAQRYLHPRYRSSYKELKGWMAEYADHPDAARVYKLALTRKPKNAKAPRPPESVLRFPILAEGEPDAEMADEIDVALQRLADADAPRPAPQRKLSRDERRESGKHERLIADLVRRGQAKAALRHLESPHLQRLFGRVEYDRARALVAQGYYVSGQDQVALELARKAAERSGAEVPEALRTAGLAAWRLGLYWEAARHFEALSQNTGTSPWLVSAAAFWAARAHLKSHQPQHHNRLMAAAAAHPRTFYGLLARHILGVPVGFQWQTPALERKAFEALSRMPAGRRAVALMQVGEDRRAERELFALAAQGQPDFAKLILAFAGREALPALAVKLDTLLFPDGGGLDGAAYPLPRWAPTDGYRVDRALIYALIRQESGFNPLAKSRAGAAGLMQLMPGTASFVASDQGYRRTKRDRLYGPELNITLGQRYLEILLDDDNIKGDLFLLAAAWNGGPGNLSKWLKRADYQNDPLLFIESVPSRETRVFIERVLANLWIYRHRLGQPTPSLVALAEGAWPVYAALDQEPVYVAQTPDERR